MRVYCKECGSKGRIASRDELSKEFAKLYCQCGSATCGHTWVANLTFSHTLSPSAQAADRLRDMPPIKQRELFDLLDARPSTT